MTDRHRYRRARFTDASVKALKARAETYHVWESGGFGLRVHPSGRKSWIYLYRIGDRLRRLTFGTYPELTLAEARKAHADAAWHRARKVDPAERMRPESDGPEPAAPLTVARLVEEFIRRYSRPRKASWKDDQRLLTKEILPRYGSRPAIELRRRDLVGLLEAVAERAPITANRLQAVLSKMFTWAVEFEHLETAPLPLRKPSRETPRDRFLSTAEIRQFMATIGGPALTMSGTTALALLTILATAARPGEVAGATWAEFDLDDGWWIIPGARTKNGRSHRVPISRFARSLLDQARKLNPHTSSPFPGNAGRDPMRPASLTRAVARNRPAFGFEFTPHDLRRTAASHMSSAGTPRVVIARILNHSDKSTTAIYDRHTYDKEAREAIEAWGRTLKRLKGETT